MAEWMALRWILHVDMDAFYASVEALDDPSLAGKPLIVGGTGRRGVVASCSYEARAFGVRSAMPSERARRLCPQALFVPGRYERYGEVSRHLHEIFRRYTPTVEGISLDEAFLDVSGSVRLLGPVESIADSLRSTVAAATGLQCSVGGATVKFLAKLASEAAKPGRGHGVHIVEPGNELAFLQPLPIEALWGVGAATGARLKRLGLTTIGDLAAVPAGTLEAAIGRAHGRHLWELAQGIDERGVVADREVKSVSHEETFGSDRHDTESLRIEIVRMADSVASRLRKAGLAGRTVAIKVRFGDFRTITRSTTSAPTDQASDISAAAWRLLGDVDVGPGVRLLGVGVSNLVEAAQRPAEQLALDLSGRPSGRSARATEAVDAVRDRFGAAAVGPASLVSREGIQVKRPGDTQWGPRGA